MWEGGRVGGMESGTVEGGSFSVDMRNMHGMGDCDYRRSTSAMACIIV